MESIRKIVTPRIIGGPVDLSLLLSTTVSIKIKLQLVQKISDSIEECCRSQNYFDNMIFVLLKLLTVTEPTFSPDHDIFKLRKLILQIIHKVCSSNDKIKNHIQSTMGACLKIIETDNEQCVIYCILIFKELLTAFKPKFDGNLNTEIVKFLKLILDIYKNSSVQEKIFNFQKTPDLKVLISTIRFTTTISKNSINYIFIPMGKVSFKVLKELAHILKLYYVLFYNIQSFKNEIIEFFPILMNFFNLELPYKPEYRDLIIDLKHAQVRLLFFFAIFLKDNKDAIRLHCSSLPGRVIGLLSCNMASDVSSLRTELLSGFESVILIDYKCEFLPYMDKFLDETLITGRSWSLKTVLRPKAYIYIDHLTTHLHNQLSINFLVRVIHLHFSNILDTTLQPEVQINLCNMVMNVLSYVVQRQNQFITNINTNEKNKNPLIDLFYRVFKIFIIKLKQFQKFYLPQLDENSISQEENVIESISSILEENLSNEKQLKYIYGYDSSQIVPYTVTDCKRFMKIIIPAIRTLFQFIVKIEGGKFSVEYHYKKSFEHFIKYSLLSLKVCQSPIKKKEMVKEILNALSCINPIYLKTFINGDIIVEQIYANSLETIIFDMALNDEVLISTFSCWMFEFILKNLDDENKRHRIFDLVDKLQLNFKLNSNEEMVDEYIYKIIKKLLNNLQDTKYPMFYLGVLKIILIIVESAKFEFEENMNFELRCLFFDLFLYHQRLPNHLVVIKTALAELCLAECVFNVVQHFQIMDVLSLIAFSLQVSELTSQGLAILEKCLDIFPNIFIDDSTQNKIIQSKIMKGLCHCMDNPSESVSKQAVSLLGKFGGLNRSSIIEPYHLTVQDQFQQISEKPTIFISFEEYSNQLLEIDIVQGVNTAVETLISNGDIFNRAHSWNVIRGFLTVSMDCNINEVTKLLSNIKLETLVDMFSNNELQHTRTITDETYIKALTGLMICCDDEHLKVNAFKYLNEFIKTIVHIAISYFSGILCDHSLEVNPYILIETITIVLSNEKETVSKIGELAIDLVMSELHIILGNNMVHFPFIKYMFRKFCELCYDVNWICKHGGCSGLQVLFSKLLIEEAMANEFSDWFIKHYFIAFKAMMFMFTDFNRHLTFGALKTAESNLNVMLNWVYRTKPINPAYVLLQDTILMELISNIVGPNDLKREQSIKLVKLMAKNEQKTVLSILEPYNEHIKSLIPGNKLFNTYTYKTQMGIMKGHIFCALYSFPAEKLDFSNKKHKFYFNTLCIVCKNKNKKIKKMKMFKDLTSYQLYDFRQTAMKVIVNSFNFLTKQKKKEVFYIIFNILRSPDLKLQEITYQYLKSSNSKLLLQRKKVDRVFIYYSDLFQDHKQVTLVNIQYVLYLSKLYPSSPNSKLCTLLMNAFKHKWDDLHRCKNKTAKYEFELILMNILETICLITDSQFFHIKEICEIIFKADTLNIDLSNRFYPLLTECLIKFPEDSLVLFFQEQNIKNFIWTSFINSIIRNEKAVCMRKVLTSDHSRLETLLSSAKNDPSRTIQYECIKIIYNLVQMDKTWISTSKNIISLLLTIWSNPQYKERYKNLAAIKSSEWDEPKMLLKIILAYFKANIDEVCILFQILPVLSYRFPMDINFFRKYLENEIIKSFTIQWKRKVFFKFVDLYPKRGSNNEILGKVLKYLILPCFSMCYKNGEKEQLLCTFTKSDENIIGILLNKIFNNMRASFCGCDFDGIKLYLCQLLCLLIEDLLNFNDNICDLIYNAIISCTWPRCTMDINVKFHCYLILTYIMLSGHASKREKLNQGIYYELLKASSAEAQPVINYSLNLIVSAVYEKNKEVNTLVVCVKKIMTTESQTVPTLHHICSFLIKYNTLFYPYKQFLIRNILGSLFPIAKNNNVPEFKKTAIDLACMIIKWELTDDDENMKLKYTLKRKIDGTSSTTESNNMLSQKKKSSETIDNCLNFLAMVGCQTHDDKQESRISKLAMRSATLFKHILATEPIETKEVKLKFGWIEKLLDTFLKKENLTKQNPNAHSNTNASVMNLLTTFDIISFMLSVLSQKLMLEAIIPLQDHLIKFLQLAFNESLTISYSHNQREMSSHNRLSVSQIKQYNEGTLKIISEILKTFPSNEGLENLHVYIQMIISEGLNSNCPRKLEISLTLLQNALIHFPTYMDNEIINTIGDIMFKFNENNTNPLVKVKCLEIIKTHVDTLPRIGKQVFIEKVVMENLDKARNTENSITFEVQIKCFELIIMYIKDLSEATEGILLNSILLEYIKTTTDERIMTIILNVITKWIEICRDESVFFNCQIINILKCTSTLNHFPNITEYCYKLNLEIFKNWYFKECIEYGLDCKTPSIRYDFLNFFDTLWHDGTLCKRLYTIMSDELYYDLEFSLAFYVQLLLVKISKNKNIQGNFPLLYLKKICDTDDTPTVLENFSSPVQSIHTYDMCSSLAQLCFVDSNLAKNIWISIIPGIWSLFNDNQRKLLSSKAMKFLENNKLKNNFKAAFYEAIIQCEPKINFEPYQMVYIGKSYNLWYKVIEQMEDICNYFHHDKKNKAIEGMIQMYSLLREEDVLESLFQNTIKCDDTKNALSLEQQGCFKKASLKYAELLNREVIVTEINQINNYNKDNEFRKIRLTKCLRELNDWNYISGHILEEDNFLLNIETIWKKSIGKSACDNLKWHLENKQHIWPNKLHWKYHFYLGMLNLEELDQQAISTAQEHIELATKDIVDKWKVLPKYKCNAHMSLLQATQLVVEIKEVLNIQKNWLQTPHNINNINLLIEVWNNRKPWIGDNLNVWNDLISWRQTYYSFLTLRNLNSDMYNIKTIQDQSKLIFGETALKQNMIDVCMKILQSLDPNDVTASNWLNKMYLETKCVQKITKYNKNINGITDMRLAKEITDNIKPLWLIIRGSFQYYSGNTDIAFKCFATALFNQTVEKPSNIEWKYVIENNFKCISQNFQKCTDNGNQLNHFAKILNSNEILENAWIQWAILIQNNFDQQAVKDINIALAAMKCYIIASKLTSKIKSNIIIARILWLLTFDDDNHILLCTLEKCHITFSDLWLPQMLNIFVEINKLAIQRIVLKIGQIYPQEMYLLLNRMYLTEKINKTIEMKSLSENSSRDDVQKISTRLKKIDRIKRMMNIMHKRHLGVTQLNYFIYEILALEESWDEELRRNLYECLYLSYDYAFENKNFNVQVPKKISHFIKTTIMSCFDYDFNTVKVKRKKSFLVPDNLSKYHEFFKQKFPIDFGFASVPTINLLVCQLKKWIKYLENKSNYPTKFIHEFRCPKIHKVDWSVIRLPSNNYIHDFSKAVRLHNFSGHIYLKDKSGAVIKQLTIRGTDGLLYTYNISKSTQGIESEERILQLFYVANNYILDFKETAKRFLKFSIPRTFTIAPHLRMVETNRSMFSLFEVYKEMTTSVGIDEDIEFWFSIFNTCIVTEKTSPLKESLILVEKKFVSDQLLKNWVSLRYPLQSDYWTFRKTFIEHYSLLCFFEYAFNLIKLKPEMLNIDENNGVVNVLHYKFFLDKFQGNLVQSHTTPFRMTPNLTKFITPYRKYQIINCLTATGQCINNSIEDISIVLKLLLKDEFIANYNINNCKKILNKDMVKTVDRNLNYILKNFDQLKTFSTYNLIPDLLDQAINKDLLCHESPTWRPWL